MYYHHLNNLIALFFVLPSLVQLLSVNTDILIIPRNAPSGFVLLEETKPTRIYEFRQCINQSEQLHLDIDEKYGDLILTKPIGNVQSNQQRLLCTIHRNQSTIVKLYYTILHSTNDISFTSPIYHADPMSFVVHRFRGIECRPASSSIHYEFVDPSVPLSINERTGELSTKD
ncbi:unnamed protein product, partial [Adineta ricciae]